MIPLFTAGLVGTTLGIWLAVLIGPFAAVLVAVGVVLTLLGRRRAMKAIDEHFEPPRSLRLQRLWSSPMRAPTSLSVDERRPRDVGPLARTGGGRVWRCEGFVGVGGSRRESCAGFCEGGVRGG